MEVQRIPVKWGWFFRTPILPKNVKVFVDESGVRLRTVVGGNYAAPRLSKNEAWWKYLNRNGRWRLLQVHRADWNDKFVTAKLFQPVFRIPAGSRKMEKA